MVCLFREEKLGRKRKNSRGTSRSTTQNRSKNKSKYSLDLAVISLLLISILLFVLIYGETGAIGEVLSPVLGGIIGFIKYFIPIGMLAIAVSVARDNREYVMSKLIQYVIFLACIAAMLTIFQISKGTINVDLEFKEVLQVAYDLGEKNIGGGTVGAVIAYPLISLFGMFGAAIAAVGTAIILLVFTFGIEPSKIIAAFLDKIDEERASNREEMEAAYNRRKQKSTFVEIDDEEEPKPVRRKLEKKAEKAVPEAIEEDQITINLNNSDIAEEPKEEKVKFNIFNKNQEVKAEKEEIEEKPKNNPDEIEANLFKVEEETKETKTKAVLQLAHNEVSVDDENYEFPPVELMKVGDNKANKGGKKALADTATRLQKTLYSFGVSAKVENVSVGPAITRYELKPAEGVRVSKIAKLSDDIALNLAAESIRIEAPIPGKQAVGIEIPNKEKEVVHLREIIESTKFQDAESNLSVALGKDIAGDPVIADIAKMPHVLIAGSTGSGKSVCINTLIASILYKAKPSEVKLLMVDPKVVELSIYNGIPHLLIPVVTDSKKAAGALAWAVQEMENRYQLFAQKNVRDLKGYNAIVEREKEERVGKTDEHSQLEEKYDQGKLPQIVIIIDELADLMMVAAKDVEDAICRLAQKARAAGMHLVIATQRPSVDVITGIIKANVPSRIAFAVSSQIDSRTILDMAGAEKLLGKGDMLFYPIGASKPVRVQGSFVDDKEVEKIVSFIKKDGEQSEYSKKILEQIENSSKSDKERDEDLMDDDDETDPLLTEAIEYALEVGQASVSMFQRKFKIGYSRAGRLIDSMHERGIISGFEGSKPRKLLMTKERWAELNMMQPPAGDFDDENE
jgi:S-DNA-T family DNA segregation ATPase FtsK/SpoIIIE